MAKEKLIVKFGDEGDEIEEYICTPIPRVFKLISLVVFIWGAYWFYSYSSGSTGWLDRGYWQELERAANTRLWEKAIDD